MNSKFHIKQPEQPDVQQRTNPYNIPQDIMKVLGMGNALLDVLLPIENDQILEELNLPRVSACSIYSVLVSGLNDIKLSWMLDTITLSYFVSLPACCAGQTSSIV